MFFYLTFHFIGILIYLLCNKFVTYMNSITTSLTKLGLSTHAADIYVFLLERGQKTASELVSELHLYRPQVYRALAELYESHLVIQTVSGKQKKYYAEHPKKLQRLAQDVAEHISEIIPELEERALRKNTRPFVKILEGSKGIRAVFDDVVESCTQGEIFYRYTSELDLDKVNSFLAKDYRTKRDAKKLERFVISNRLSGNQKKRRLERTIKYIPQDDPFNQNIIELVYANKVAIIDLNTQTSLLIENESIAAFQKVIFRNLYKRLT